MFFEYLDLSGVFLLYVNNPVGGRGGEIDFLIDEPVFFLYVAWKEAEFELMHSVPRLFMLQRF